jgi:hypothetical protein
VSELPAELRRIRRRIAGQYLRGTGLEVGALHSPLELSGVNIRYVDRMPVADFATTPSSSTIPEAGRSRARRSARRRIHALIGLPSPRPVLTWLASSRTPSYRHPALFHNRLCAEPHVMWRPRSTSESLAHRQKAVDAAERALFALRECAPPCRAASGSVGCALRRRSRPASNLTGRWSEAANISPARPTEGCFLRSALLGNPGSTQPDRALITPVAENRDAF